MEIEPTYLTFEQAKLLKEKGFDLPCKQRFWVGYENQEHFQDNCTNENWNNYDDSSTIYYSAPEQWQVVEWLRINHNIDLQVICNYSKLGRTYRMGIIFINKKNKIDTIFIRPKDYEHEFIEFNSPQEAYSAAFDYVLKELI